MLSLDPNAAQKAWTYAAVVMSLLALFMIRKTLMVFAISIMFAYLLYPLVQAIDRRSPWKSPLPALVLPFLMIMGLVVGFTWFIEEPATIEAKQLLASIRSSQLSSWAPLGVPMGAEIESHSGELLGLVSRLGVERGLGHVVNSLTNLFLVPVIGFLLLKSRRDIQANALEFFGIGADSEGFIQDAHVLLLDYMRALLLLAFTTLLTFTVALRLLGIPYAVFLAFVSFALEFIPLVGPLIAAAAILSVGWHGGSNAGHLVAVGCFLLGYRVFQDYVFAPMIMRRGVQLHPLLIIFGIFAGGDIGGVAGIFLSVPILALVRLLYYEIRHRRAPHSNSLHAVTA